MANTPVFQWEYPLGSDDMNVPDDVGTLAIDIENTLIQQINSNVVTDVIMNVVSAGNEGASITNGVLTLNVAPPGVENMITISGGTFEGNVDFGVGAQLSANEPTSSNNVATKNYVDTLLPVGTIIAFAGNIVPQGWTICDGRAHNSTALLSLLGSTNAPDLTDRFLLGTKPTNGDVRSAAGSSTITLSIANLPPHNHAIDTKALSHNHTGTIASAGSTTAPLVISNSGYTGTTSTEHTHTGTTGSESANHTHLINPPVTNTSSNGNHSHGTGYKGNYMIQGSDSPNNAVWFVTQTTDTLYDTYSTTGAHVHTVDIGQFASGANSNIHTHNFTSGGMNSNASHSHTVSGTVNLSHSHTIAISSADLSHNHTSQNTGSGTPINNVPASYKVYYIIYGGR